MDTAETRRMRANLATINEDLSSFRISLPIRHGAHADLPPFRLRRIFSQASFGLGGRFYNGPWINLPEKARRGLLIDGEETIEIDFSALHPRLIYAIEGRPLDAQEDPYRVHGWEAPERRGYAKTAFQQILNASADTQIRKPADLPMNAVGKGEWPRLVTKLEAKHAAVSHWFRSGRGLELQRIDSDMAEQVILEMLGNGVCCLPVHDSFIVPLSARDALSDAMDRAYKAATGA